MRYRADELYYEQVKIFGKQALFSDLRIVRESVPKGFLLYEVRHDDECLGDPVQVAKGVLVNFWGTLLVEGGLEQVETYGCCNIEEGDWKHAGESCTLKEYFLTRKSIR